MDDNGFIRCAVRRISAFEIARSRYEQTSPRRDRYLLKTAESRGEGRRTAGRKSAGFRPLVSRQWQRHRNPSPQREPSPTRGRCVASPGKARCPSAAPCRVRLGLADSRGSWRPALVPSPGAGERSRGKELARCRAREPGERSRCRARREARDASSRDRPTHGLAAALDRDADAVGRPSRADGTGRPRGGTLDLLHIRTPHFIKWDARPGNAIARRDRTVAWFDWEHCGARNQLDDVAWLLADEYVPDWAAVEHELLGRYLDRFAGESGIDQAADNLAAFGTFHMCVRLGLIVRHKSDGSWWDREYCLSRDKVGVTLEAARGTCAKAARWAERTPLTEDLVPWFEAVAARLEES